MACSKTGLPDQAEGANIQMRDGHEAQPSSPKYLVVDPFFQKWRPLHSPVQS